MPKFGVKRKELTKVVNAILESTGCRELCRQCVEKGAYRGPVGGPLVLDGKTYGYARGGCCGPQEHLGDDAWVKEYNHLCKYAKKGGCGLKNRPLACLLFTCDMLERRLSEFGLTLWMELLKGGIPDSMGDIRRVTKKRTYTLNVPAVEFKWEEYKFWRA